jgi:hypothetical protein
MLDWLGVVVFGDLQAHDMSMFHCPSMTSTKRAIEMAITLA